jgi:sugar O-acyltransferase (sialic acid O-acetyltransferase NeuD family)
MMESIVLLGGGGHCKSCIEAIESTGQFVIAGIVDNATVGSKVLGYPIIGNDDDLPILTKKYKNFAIAVGQIKTSDIRKKIYSRLKQLGANLPVIIASTAYVGRNVNIDEGTIVFHNVIINAESKVGKCCIINTKSLIEHESAIGDFCHISTGSIVNGQVTIGDSCFIGSLSVLRNNITISDHSFIPMGSVVKRNI